jgi:hypothetical protein
MTCLATEGLPVHDASEHFFLFMFMLGLWSFSIWNFASLSGLSVPDVRGSSHTIPLRGKNKKKQENTRSRARWWRIVRYLEKWTPFGLKPTHHIQTGFVSAEEKDQKREGRRRSFVSPTIIDVLMPAAQPHKKKK